MKLFETAFQKDFDYYERVFDTELNKSIVRKISTPFEWFEPSETGDFKSITDNSKRYVRKQGNSKQARNKDGSIAPIYRNIRDSYWLESFNKNPRIFYLDIETRTGVSSKGFPKPAQALEEVCLIQVYDNYSKTMFIFGDKPWSFEHLYKDKFDYTVKYYNCENEQNIFEGYLKLFKQLDPLIVYAWNGEGFDYPYLYNRAGNIGIDQKRFSNHGKVSLRTIKAGFKEKFNLQADGHIYFDLLDVYKNFTFGLKSSYSLDNIAFEELGENKVAHPEYDKFDDFYTGKYIIPENPTEEQMNSPIYKAACAYRDTKEEKYLKLVQELSHSEFVYYGIKDTYLILRIDKKKNFTRLMVMLAEKMGILLSDSLGTVKPWSQYIANVAYKKKEIIEFREINDDTIEVKGGRVTSPVIGKHLWTISVDVNSMYPNLGMRAFNMSPEKFVPKFKLPNKLKEYLLRYFNDEDEDRRLELFNTRPEIFTEVSKLLKDNGLCLGINGAVFETNNIGMVPTLIRDIYSERKDAKKTMFEYEKKKLLIKDSLKEKGA